MRLSRGLRVGLVCTFCLFSLLGSGCVNASTGHREHAGGGQNGEYSSPVVAGRIEAAEINESSGLAASKCRDGVLWTHNDAGNDAVIFAITPEGTHLGTWAIQNVKNIDWEDIDSFRDTAGKCYLLIGDIGDNDGTRDHLSILRLPEPDVPGTKAPGTLQAGEAEVLKFSYGGTRYDAETLLADPRSGNLYVLTKRKKGASTVHKIPPRFGSAEIIAAEKVADLAVPSSPEGLLTGGAASPDGRRVALCDVKNGYELVLPSDAASFDAIWAQKPAVIDVGERKQGEGVTYSMDGSAIYASSERKNAPIYRVERRATR